MYALLLIVVIALLCGVRPRGMFGALAIGGLLGLVFLLGIHADDAYPPGVPPPPAVDIHSEFLAAQASAAFPVIAIGRWRVPSCC